jgi:uncharacterized protein (DUF2384 family)
MASTKPKAVGPAAEATVVTKAVLRAAKRLQMTHKSLAGVLGVSEATVSRMNRGEYVLQRGQKPYELAILVVRLYRSLDAITGGDDAVASSWLRNPNSALNDRPITLIETIPGLVNVIEYVDARRAVV